jgi:hypothetical protein
VVVVVAAVVVAVVVAVVDSSVLVRKVYRVYVDRKNNLTCLFVSVIKSGSSH